jgi:CHAD domain-containing protein
MSDHDVTPVAQALAGIADGQCRAAMRALGNVEDRHGGVHQARKAIRRLRATLILCRKAFGDALLPVDRDLQRLASSLSSLRDAQAVIGTAEKLATDGHDEWLAVADALRRRRDTLLDDALAKDPGFKRRCHQLRAARQAISALPWSQLRAKTLRKAWEKTTSKVDELADEHAAKPTAASLHRWRRRVRRQRLQLETLRKLHKKVGQHAAAHLPHKGKTLHELTKLANELGFRQDLQVLRAALVQVADPARLPHLRGRIRDELMPGSRSG